MSPSWHAPQRRFFAALSALAVLLALLQGMTGLTDLVLYAGPALLIAALLRVPARTLSSLLAHDPRGERGPPAPARTSGALPGG